MQPIAPLEYATLRPTVTCSVRHIAWRLRRSILTTVTTLLVLYTAAYFPIRQSHTRFWFEKETQRKVPYTLFDAYSRSELYLYAIFWPACTVDQVLTNRWFEYDKW